MKEKRELLPPGQITFSKENSSLEEPQIENVKFLAEVSPGSVEMSLSITVNLGNFESVKYGLSLEESFTGYAEDTRDNKFEDFQRSLSARLAATTPTIVKECKKVLAVVHKDLDNTKQENVSNQVKRFNVKKEFDDDYYYGDIK